MAHKEQKQMLIDAINERKRQAEIAQQNSSFLTVRLSKGERVKTFEECLELIEGIL